MIVRSAIITRVVDMFRKILIMTVIVAIMVQE